MAEWERVAEPQETGRAKNLVIVDFSIWRLPVPGGWLYKNESNGAMVFVANSGRYPRADQV